MKKKFFKRFVFLLLLFVFMFSTGYGFGRFTNMKNLSAKIAQIPEIEPEVAIPTNKEIFEPEVISVDTSNWKTYTNIRYNYTFNYPSKFKFGDSKLLSEDRLSSVGGFFDEIYEQPRMQIWVNAEAPLESNRDLKPERLFPLACDKQEGCFKVFVNYYVKSGNGGDFIYRSISNQGSLGYRVNLSDFGAHEFHFIENEEGRLYMIGIITSIPENTERNQSEAITQAILSSFKFTNQ